MIGSNTFRSKALASLLLIVAVVTQFVKSCRPEQMSITHGSEHNEITFAFLSSSECTKAMVMIQKADTEDPSETTLSDSEQYNGYQFGFLYSKYAYFFKTKIELDTVYHWWIIDGESTEQTDSDDKYSHKDYYGGPISTPISEEAVAGYLNKGPFTFKIRDPKDYARYIFVADMGNTFNSNPTHSALRALNWSEIDGYIHAGDFAYNLETDDGKNGDYFFRAQQPFTAQVPYLVVAGNHEIFDKGNLFEFRFRMPGYTKKHKNKFYKVQRGTVLFVFIDFEFILEYHESTEEALLAVKELLAAYENDTTVEWRVIVSHRPIYCGEFYQRSDCRQNFWDLKGFDDLYRRYKIDLILNGHQHYYERMYLFDSWMKKTEAHVEILSNAMIVNEPKAPVQIIAGCAGNFEDFASVHPQWANVSYKVNNNKCYLDIRARPGSFEVHAMNSDTKKTMDKVALTKKGSSIKYYKNALETKRRFRMDSIVEESQMIILEGSAASSQIIKP